MRRSGSYPDVGTGGAGARWGASTDLTVNFEERTMFTHPDIDFRIAKQIQHERHLAAAQRRLEAAARSARPARTRGPRTRRVPVDATGPFAVLDPC